jgi:hypothetical protein
MNTLSFSRGSLPVGPASPPFNMLMRGIPTGATGPMPDAGALANFMALQLANDPLLSQLHTMQPLPLWAAMQPSLLQTGALGLPRHSSLLESNVLFPLLAQSQPRARAPEFKNPSPITDVRGVFVSWRPARSVPAPSVTVPSGSHDGGSTVAALLPPPHIAAPLSHALLSTEPSCSSPFKKPGASSAGAGTEAAAHAAGLGRRDRESNAASWQPSATVTGSSSAADGCAAACGLVAHEHAAAPSEKTPGTDSVNVDPAATHAPEKRLRKTRAGWTCDTCGVSFPQRARLVAHEVSRHRWMNSPNWNHREFTPASGLSSAILMIASERFR